jgi:hypothetical protein
MELDASNYLSALTLGVTARPNGPVVIPSFSPDMFISGIEIEIALRFK